MTYTVNLIDSGVLHRLENVSDDVAHDIMMWWLPEKGQALVPEYFKKVITDEDGKLRRALLLRRSSISGIDIVPDKKKSGSEKPGPKAPAKSG